jgi:hypothetical protein
MFKCWGNFPPFINNIVVNMKFFVFLLFSINTITPAFAADVSDYIKLSHESNIKKCDVLLDRNFSYFDKLKNKEYRLYKDNLRSLSDDINSIRFYFSYGDEQDLFIGDITLIQTPTECQSFLQINATIDNQSCDFWQQHSANNWKVDDSQHNTKWLVNENGKFASITEINEGKGCMFKYFLTDYIVFKG